MTEPLMIFGKEVEGCGGGWSAKLGIFSLFVYCDCESDGDGRFGAHVGLRGATGNISSRWHDSKELARDWLESEARRIMRECFEIAGPMTAERRIMLGGDYAGKESLNVRFRHD